MAWRLGYTDKVNEIMAAGVPPFISNDARGANGINYYVSGNYGHDGNTGLSWDSPFLTLAHAFAVSHANIAANSKGWAARNTIFISGDTFVEDLVAWPQKTDVVGVGSDDGFSMAGVTGNHAPINAAIGTRFFNIRFLTSAAGIIVDLTAACSATQFIGCLFDATGTAHTATTGIRATASTYLKVKGCRFQGAFSTSYITLGTGQALGTEIENNVMTDGAAGGIIIGAGATSAYRSLIRKNHIQCAGKVIDTQATSVFNVVDNTLISAAALGASSYVIDLTFAVGNRITGNDVSATIPVIPAT